MKYVVELDNIKFEFDDGQTALSWAELAENNRIKDEYSCPIQITLKKGGDEE